MNSKWQINLFCCLLLCFHNTFLKFITIIKSDKTVWESIMKKIIFSNPLKNRFGITVRDLRKNAPFIVFLILLFLGIAIGAVHGQKGDTALMNRLDFIFLTNFDIRCTQGVLSSFISSFATAFIFLIVIFLLGLSMWGEILIAAIPFFKGYGYGLSVGYLYCMYGFYGIMYNILIILPGAFLCSVIIAAASQEAFRNSLKFASCCIRSSTSENLNMQTKKYIVSMLWCLFLAAISSLADMLFSLCFSWIFDFT